MTERVSIHLCTKDRFTELALCLESLRNQSYKAWDLVLVDGSMPNPLTTHRTLLDVLNKLRLEGHEVIYVRDEYNQGVCHARNLAIEKDFTGNALIARVDDDTISEPGYLEKLVALIKDEAVGIAAGIVPQYSFERVYRSSKGKNTLSQIEVDLEGNVLSIGDELWAFYEPNGVFESHHARSSFVFRRSMLEKIKEKFGFGYFPTDYGKAGFREESDFCIKALSCGYKILIDTSAVQWHLATPSGGTKHADYAQQVAIADEHFRRKIKWWHKRGLLPKQLYAQNLGQLGGMRLG